MKTKMDKQAITAEDSLISQAKAAELCGMTRAAIQDLLRRGRFQSVKEEGRDLVYLKEIEAFAKSEQADGSRP